MKLQQVKEALEAEVLVGEESLDIDITMACGADLLSDVPAFTKSESLLLTALTHPHVQFVFEHKRDGVVVCQWNNNIHTNSTRE